MPYIVFLIKSSASLNLQGLSDYGTVLQYTVAFQITPHILSHFETAHFIRAKKTGEAFGYTTSFLGHSIRLPSSDPWKKSFALTDIFLRKMSLTSLSPCALITPSTASLSRSG